MPTLAGFNGASVVPDYTGALRQGGQAYSAVRQIGRENAADEAVQKAMGGDMDAMALLSRLDPQAGKYISGLIASNDQKALEAARRESEDYARNAAFILQQDPKNRTQALLEVGRSLRDQGKSLDPIIKLMDMPPEQQQRELERVIYANMSMDQLYQSMGMGGGANSQFGAQETFKDSKGNLFFGTTRRNPSTGQVESVLAAVDGSGAQPQGKVEMVGRYGLTASEDTTKKAEDTTATKTAEAGVDLVEKPKIESAVVAARKYAEAEAAKRAQQSGQLSKLEDADRIYKALSSEDLDLIYGRGETWYPGFLRSQKGIDLMADRDQLVGMLKMGARGELKGQGPISDSEQGMLAESISVLGNESISPEKARQALDDAMRIIYGSAGKEFSPDGGKKTGAVNWSDL